MDHLMGFNLYALARAIRAGALPLEERPEIVYVTPYTLLTTLMPFLLLGPVLCLTQYSRLFGSTDERWLLGILVIFGACRMMIEALHDLLVYRILRNQGKSYGPAKLLDMCWCAVCVAVFWWFIAAAVIHALGWSDSMRMAAKWIDRTLGAGSQWD